MTVAGRPVAAPPAPAAVIAPVVRTDDRLATSGSVRWLATAIFFAVATCLFYWPVTFGGGIFTDYDLLVYFYPYQEFLGVQLRAARLPLWNPYLFGGAPFLANIQTGVFYPPNWLAALLPPPYLTIALTLFHVWLAGFGLTAFSRTVAGLAWPAALVAGLSFTWGGFLTQQAAHPNQLAAAAWLPVLLLCIGRARPALRSLWTAAGCLVVTLLLLAGHSQEAYYGLLAGAFFALYQAGRLLRGLPAKAAWPARVRAAEPIVAFGLMAAAGAAIAAVQLLPTAELSRLGIRSGGWSYDDAITFSLPPWLAPHSLLPFTVEHLPTPEYVGYTGVVALVLAAAGLISRHPLRWFAAGLALAGLLLAFGGYDPLYYLAYHLVPGVGLFRVPARWLLWTGLGLAILAGLGADRVLGTRFWPARPKRRILLLVGIAAALGFCWLVAPNRLAALAWTAGFGPVLLLVLRPGPLRRLPRPAVAVLLAALVAGELWLAGRPLTGNQVTAPQAWFSIRPVIAQLLSNPGVHRVLSVSAPTFEPGDRFDLARVYGDRLDAAGLRALFVALKLREMFAPNLPLAYQQATLDGYDGGVLPLRAYVEFKSALATLTRRGEASRADDPPSPQPDSLLVRDLRAVPPTPILSALNVRSIIADKTLDPWVDGVYYDLGLTERIAPGERWTRAKFPGFAATRIGLVSYLENAGDLAEGEIVAELAAWTLDGRTVTWPVRFNRETAAGVQATADPAALPFRVASRWLGTDRGYNAIATFDLPEPVLLDSLTLATTGPATIVLRGLSLIDGRTDDSVPVTLRPELAIVQSGDLKVYENRAVLPRGFLTAPGAIPTDAAGFLERPPAPRPESDGTSELVAYEPGHARFTVRTTEPADFLFTEAAYPGWQATLNGEALPSAPAGGLFQQVAVPPGDHVLEFRFMSRPVILGGAVSTAGLLSVLAFAGWSLFQRGRRTSWPR